MSCIPSIVARSQSHNEIVTIEAANKIAANALLDEISEFYQDNETDYVDTGEVIEVWDWTDEQDEGDMDFRVHIRYVDPYAYLDA